MKVLFPIRYNSGPWNVQSFESQNLLVLAIYENLYNLFIQHSNNKYFSVSEIPSKFL